MSSPINLAYRYLGKANTVYQVAKGRGIKNKARKVFMKHTVGKLIPHSRGRKGLSIF